MYGGNLDSGSGAGNFSTGFSGNQASDIGCRTAIPEGVVEKFSWRNFFHGLVPLFGFIAVIEFIYWMIVLYGPVPVLLLAIIVLFLPRREVKP
jgi:hypothetical protein